MRRRCSYGEGRASAARTRDPATGWCLLGGAVGLERLDRDQSLQLEKALLSHASNVHELFHFLESAVLLPVFDDPFRGPRADPWQGLELRRGRGVQIERTGTRRCRRRCRWFG